MILPGMEPHLTRGGMGANRLFIEKYAETPENFLIGRNDLWLPPTEVAERELARNHEKLMQLHEQQAEAEMPREWTDKTLRGARIMGRTAITETGCYVDGLRGNQTAEGWVIDFASWEWGSPSFNTADEAPELRICSTDDCYNSRHYDLEFSRPTLRERKVELDPSNYIHQPDGTIKTIWGDTLPSIEQSLEYYIRLQRENYPFVPHQDSPLTPTALAQIRFVAETGCWESWQYYCKPEENVNWQFDGYGRLYQRYTAAALDEETGEYVPVKRRGHWLAHRVIWSAMGNQLVKGMVLNHLCSYRRCCNPLHIEQVSASENVYHGIDVQNALKTKQPPEQDAPASSKTTQEDKVRSLYTAMTKSIVRTSA